MTQPSLFDATFDMRDRSIQERFSAWLDSNPHVFELFRQFAQQARDSGHKRFSSNGIIQRLRWELNVTIKREPGSEFKINDQFSSRLARKLIEVDPSFDGFFELRELKSA